MSQGRVAWPTRRQVSAVPVRCVSPRNIHSCGQLCRVRVVLRSPPCSGPSLGTVGRGRADEAGRGRGRGGRLGLLGAEPREGRQAWGKTKGQRQDRFQGSVLLCSFLFPQRDAISCGGMTHVHRTGHSCWVGSWVSGKAISRGVAH